jgi:hypothetical protein
MKGTIFFFVILIAVPMGIAQTDDHGIEIHGSVYDWDFVKYEFSHETFRDPERSTANLAMEIVNTGHEPVILINPNGRFDWLQSKVEMFYTPWTRYIGGEKPSEVLGFSRDVKPRWFYVGGLKGIADDLDKPEPPQNLTVILKPGESIGFHDNLYIKQKREKVSRKGRTDQIVWEGTNREESYYTVGRAAQDFDALVITYRFSLAKYVKDPYFLEKLQTRWRKFGYLPIDSSGEMTIVSHRIEN